MASPARRRRTPPLTAAAWATALALMHGGPARAAAACPGPGPATSYEHFVLARPLPDAERAVAQAVRVWGQQRGRALRYDERLGRAAAAVLPDVLGQVGAPLPMAALTAAARAEGLTDGELAAVAISAPAHRLARSVALELAAGALAGCEASHLGVALSAQPRASAAGPEADGAIEPAQTALILLSRRLVRLGPLPRCRPLGGRLALSGSVADAATKAVLLAASWPDGSVARTPLWLEHGHFVGTLPVGQTPGAMRLELLVERGRGPEVAAALSVQVGDTAAAAPAGTQSPPASLDPPSPLALRAQAPAAAPSAAQALMALVWGVRAAHGLPLPTPTPSLMQAASAHARDMRDRGYFAHVSRRTGDASSRLRRLGQPFVHVVENLALAASPQDALFLWSQSPGHLENLLDARVDAAGLGIAEVPGQGLLVVLLMAQLPR